ncbi:hypothetical protein QF037_000615 [Streptomyces canus]|nr:hypothetical protein [Streptomyces canus]
MELSPEQETRRIAAVRRYAILDTAVAERLVAVLHHTPARLRASAGRRSDRQMVCQLLKGVG